MSIIQKMINKLLKRDYSDRHFRITVPEHAPSVPWIVMINGLLLSVVFVMIQSTQQDICYY